MPREGQFVNFTWYINEESRSASAQPSDASCVTAKRPSIVVPVHLAAVAAARIYNRNMKRKWEIAWYTAPAPLSLRQSTGNLACVPVLYNSKLFSYTCRYCPRDRVDADSAWSRRTDHLTPPT